MSYEILDDNGTVVGLSSGPNSTGGAYVATALSDFAPTPTIAMIKEEAQRRITQKYPLFKQINITADYGTDSDDYSAMRTWIDAIRSISNNLEESLPTDYTDDSYWVVESDSSAEDVSETEAS